VKDSVGDRQKMLESQPPPLRFDTHMPVVARMDGRAFHQFTKGLERPYDARMAFAMQETTRHLVEETGACIGYTQSDEITLVLAPVAIEGSGWFGFRTQKMLSQLGAQTTLAFYQQIQELIPEYACKNPTFDARVWSVPTLNDAVENLLWREQDAIKNSVSMAVASMYSHNRTLNKNTRQKKEMLAAKHVNWDDYPTFFKRGTYVQRRTTTRAFSTAELEALPPKHHARTNPNLVVERHEIRILELPPLCTVANAVDVVFFGEYPILCNELESS
jgi:tRNA(His) guanylyltransferase